MFILNAYSCDTHNFDIAYIQTQTMLKMTGI